MHFSYTRAHCLFDAFHVPVHLCYSSIELGNGSIDCFLVCLNNIDIDALESYQYEIGSNFMHELHQIRDINIYISKMQLSAFSNVNENDRALWGHAFFIR
jgi:hypothetical protein